MDKTIDTVVIFVFSAFVLIIGMLFARTGRNLKSFFAGGESVPWFIGGLSLFMSFFSAGTFVAWGSIAYKHGLVSITIQWMMALGGLVTAILLAPRWKRTGALTAAQFIRARLGSSVQKFYIYIFLLVSLFSKGAVLYPVALLVSSSLNFPLIPCTIVLGLMMIAYTAVGGLWAVMVTDILQFVVLTASVLLVLPLSLRHAGGWSGFTSRVPPDFFNLLNGDYNFGFIFAFALYSITFIGGNWTFVQRYTSVESPKASRKVALLFAGLYLICPIIWMLPPMIYRSINPGLAGMDTESAYLQVCKLVLPPGLMGLMLTGMYFSTSATANTTLNVTSAIITNDIYKGMFRPDASDKSLMMVARLSSLLLGIGMIGIALLVPAAGGMIEVVLTIAAITGGPLLLPGLWALFSKKLNGKTAFFVSALSLLVNCFFKFVTPYAFALKLNRAEEMLLGASLPFVLLFIHEFIMFRKKESADYVHYIKTKEELKAILPEETDEEKTAILKQNLFGLRVIAFAMAFTALLLVGISFVSTSGKLMVLGIAAGILLCAIIPLRASKKVRLKIAGKMPGISLPNDLVA